MAYFPRLQTRGPNDRRPGLSGFPASRRGRADFGVRGGRPRGADTRFDQGGERNAWRSPQFVRRGYACARTEFHPWRADAHRRRWQRCRRGHRLQANARVHPRGGATRMPRRQCLLGRVFAGGGGPAGRPPRNNALAAHQPFPDALSERQTRTRPDLRAGRQHLEFGGNFRRHRSCAGAGPRVLATRWHGRRRGNW